MAENPVDDKETLKRITKAKINLLLNQPFFANVFGILEGIVQDDSFPTAATDGKKIYYNKAFVDKLTDDELVFLLCHEILHIVLNHIFRGDKVENKAYWNMAVDYIVNYILVKNKIGKMIKGGLYSNRFNDEMTAEEVYDILVKEKPSVEDPLDFHIVVVPGSGDSDESKSDSCENGNMKIIELPRREIDEIKNNIKENIFASHRLGVTGGNLEIPGILRQINELTNPPNFDWNGLIKEAFSSLCVNEWSYKRYHYMNSYFNSDSRILYPGYQNGYEINVVVAIDVSGSITDDMVRDFLLSVKDLTLYFKKYNVTVFCFDTKVYNVKKYSNMGDGDDVLENIMSYEIKGGGGTNYNCVYNYLKSNNIVPELLLFLTDGYPWNNDWGDKDYCPVLFILHSFDESVNRIIPPYGRYAYYKQRVR